MQVGTRKLFPNMLLDLTMRQAWS